MLRAVLCIAVGMNLGLLVGILAGYFLTGPILGRLLGLAGTLGGAHAGWPAALRWPGRREDGDLEQLPDRAAFG